MTEREDPTPSPPRMTRKEALWLAFFVLLVTATIWLSTSDVWDRWFSVEAPGDASTTNQ